MQMAPPTYAPGPAGAQGPMAGPAPAGGHQQGQQSIQQAYSQRLIGIARSLEQA